MGKNIEQIEAQLHTLKNKYVALAVPIRGTIHMSYFGVLNLKPENDFILYYIPIHIANTFICFRVQDVESISPSLQLGVEALISLKTLDWMLEEKLSPNL